MLPRQLSKKTFNRLSQYFFSAEPIFVFVWLQCQLKYFHFVPHFQIFCQFSNYRKYLNFGPGISVICRLFVNQRTFLVRNMMIRKRKDYFFQNWLDLIGQWLLITFPDAPLICPYCRWLSLILKYKIKISKSWSSFYIFYSKRIHYLMGIGPNTKQIPQNSGKQIRIPEGM